MPSVETTLSDTNTRYSVYFARQGTSDGGSEKNTTTPSIYLATHSDNNANYGLEFDFDFDETASIKHKILIPASFHDNLPANHTWWIMTLNTASPPAFQNLDTMGQWTSNTNNSGLDYEITEDISNVKYYVLKHIPAVSVELGELSSQKYKLRIKQQ